jgi:hypothetical protein
MLSNYEGAEITSKFQARSLLQAHLWTLLSSPYRACQ